MIALDHIRSGRPLSSVVIGMFRDLRVELVTERTSEGWWLAASVPFGTLHEEQLTPNDLCEFEDLWRSSRHDEFAEPVSDFVDKLLNEDVEALAAESIQAANEEQAILGRLAVELDSNAEIVMSPDRVRELYPNDPSIEPVQFWQRSLRGFYEKYVWPQLREMQEQMEFTESAARRAAEDV